MRQPFAGLGCRTQQRQSRAGAVGAGWRIGDAGASEGASAATRGEGAPATLHPTDCGCDCDCRCGCTAACGEDMRWRAVAWRGRWCASRSRLGNPMNAVSWCEKDGERAREWRDEPDGAEPDNGDGTGTGAG